MDDNENEFFYKSFTFGIAQASLALRSLNHDFIAEREQFC